MLQQEIHQFLDKYFRANNCEIIEESQGHLTVQLTIELDKALMNRPFYWHYVEKTGGIPNPAQLTFITNQSQAPEKIKGESIHFGSPRLHQIFQSTKNLASYIRLYEKRTDAAGGNVPLKPWLGLNIKISFQCDRKKDMFRSIGLQLINGRMVEGFHEQIANLHMTPKIPDLSYTLTPLIMPKSGIHRIENFLKQELLGMDHQWAEDARERWKKDIELLEHFYEDVDEKGEAYENELAALKDQYEPKIKISIINGGLFYLTEEAI